MALNLMPIDLFSAKNLSAADKANLFTERMSSTAHQREVEDLKAAGLNPVLSAQSSGATTGSAAVDNEDQIYSNPIYSLVQSVNKISTSTAKTLSEATKALSNAIQKNSKSSKKDSNGDDVSNEVADKIADDIVNKLVVKGPSDAKKQQVETYGDNYKSAPEVGFDSKVKFTGAASKLPSQVKNVISSLDAVYGSKYNISLTKLVYAIYGEKSDNMYIRDLQKSVDMLDYNALDFDKLYTDLFRTAKKGIEEKAKKRSNTDYGKGIVVGKKKSGNYGHGAHSTFNVRTER